MVTVISQETEADPEALAADLESILNVEEPSNTRIFLFGSWATYKKSFTEGDVDIFVGVPDYDYDISPTLATLTERHLSVTTTEGAVYDNRYVELHWGDVNDFLQETDGWERIELTDKLH